jgi:D-alanine-D-alanine ligase
LLRWIFRPSATSTTDPCSKHYNKIESRIPAPLDDAEALDRLKKISIEAYRAIGCRDYGRMDIRERGGRLYVLDVNPNPDLDMEASIACAAEYSGLSYPEMMHYIVSLAANRHEVYSRY